MALGTVTTAQKIQLDHSFNLKLVEMIKLIVFPFHKNFSYLDKFYNISELLWNVSSTFELSKLMGREFSSE